ncbi:MAG: hypothetical protein JSV07_01890 [Acidimicrobiia bacterium]|nr:MAG: hypothetical protein JSV07_01890 [Acidimicrobiia bacterium]
MSLVVFPFRHDDLDVFGRSIAIAASHPATTSVLCVGDLPPRAEVVAEAIAAAGGAAPVEVVEQDRIGTLRPGKGDAMLSGVHRFLDGDEDRLHFYDADIRTFSHDWITLAEAALDDGADVAKHWFHRSSTDAQITWHITKAGSALLWPESRYPDVHQPLGGEFALTRGAAEVLWEDPEVRRRSDWGIDTTITFALLKSGLTIHEVFVPEGKAHGAYGSLADLDRMLFECLDALQRLGRLALLRSGHLIMDAEGPVTTEIEEAVVFDIQATRALLAAALPHSASEVVATHPHLRPDGVWDNDRWRTVLTTLLEHFTLGDEGWEAVAFRAWGLRVLHHTDRNVPRGHTAALAALAHAVDVFRRP